MRVLQRYFASEILRAVGFVMLALLALFTFFDLMGELQHANRGGYKLMHAVSYVLLGLPGYMYEFMPIAVLIGTIYVLAQFASNSEFTIMRSAGMATGTALAMLLKVGMVFVLMTFLFGEFVAPASSRYAESMKLSAIGANQKKEFRTGLWTKDLVRENGLSGEVIGSRFLNVKEITPERKLKGVRVYEFDKRFQLSREVTAARAEYAGNNVWRLSEVTETTFPKTLSAEDIAKVRSQYFPSREVVSEVTPDILAVLFADPDRMSAYDLAAFTRHLAENKQDSERYEIAFWKKMIYPFVTLVMMMLALPFAYLHVRSGGVSLKIFSGIMIGMVFYLINSLFSHLGLLNTWPPVMTAMVPSILFMTLALAGLRYVERH